MVKDNEMCCVAAIICIHFCSCYSVEQNLGNIWSSSGNEY